MIAYLDEFLLIALAHFFAVASPGPDFAVVLKQSVSHSRRDALFCSAGIGAGILVHVSYCLVGVALIISQNEMIFNTLKYVAAAYLAWMGVQAIRAPAIEAASASTHAQETNEDNGQGAMAAFIKGFLTNVLNPKATLFFLSLFTLVIDVATPTWVQAVYGGYMALATWVWFSFLSVVLSSNHVRQFFQQSGYWFDRGIGVVLLLLAARVIWV